MHQIGGFVFDEKTGELSGPTGVERLAPRPAQLLALLAERRGEVVSRREIAARIWPGMSHGYDDNLNFCVRAVRAALGDSAREFVYIETLPRRGYRLATESEPETADRPVVAAPAPTPRFRRTIAITACMILLIAFAIWRIMPRGRPLVAVFPLTLQDSAAPLPSYSSDLQQAITERLTANTGSAVRTMGPATLPNASGNQATDRTTAADAGANYVISGTYGVRADGRLHAFMQLVRLSDGTHLWARRFRDDSNVHDAFLHAMVNSTEAAVRRLIIGPK